MGLFVHSPPVFLLSLVAEQLLVSHRYVLFELPAYDRRTISYMVIRRTQATSIFRNMLGRQDSLSRSRGRPGYIGAVRVAVS